MRVQIIMRDKKGLTRQIEQTSMLLNCNLNKMMI